MTGGRVRSTVLLVRAGLVSRLRSRLDPQTVDRVLALVLTVVAQLEVWLGNGNGADHNQTVAALVSLLATGAVAVRRRWPFEVGVAVCVGVRGAACVLGRPADHRGERRLLLRAVCADGVDVAASFRARVWRCSSLAFGLTVAGPKGVTAQERGAVHRRHARRDAARPPRRRRPGAARAAGRAGARRRRARGGRGGAGADRARAARRDRAQRLDDGRAGRRRAARARRRAAGRRGRCWRRSSRSAAAR